jgi:hypothetical protein
MNSKIGVIRLPIQRLHVELTNTCNFSCEFCPSASMTRPKGMMSLDMAKSILDQVSRSRIVNLVILHVLGEPTLHPHLLEVIEYAQHRKVDVCLTTNASRLEVDMLDRLCQAGIKQIIISLQTPDARTFAMRGANGLSFDEYARHIKSLVRSFLAQPHGGQTEVSISFLSSPWRRLIIPLMEELSIIDTTLVLRQHLGAWAQTILQDTPFEQHLPATLRQIQRATVFQENQIFVTDKLSLHTRFVGDWASHFQKKNLKAQVGYCPGLQENFGILWNGDFVFCCTDYNGRTSTANFQAMSIRDYLRTDTVQETVAGFQHFKIRHPHCQQCLGDSSHLKSIGKQIGSVLYFKCWKDKRLCRSLQRRESTL